MILFVVMVGILLIVPRKSTYNFIISYILTVLRKPDANAALQVLSRLTVTATHVKLAH